LSDYQIEDYRLQLARLWRDYRLQIVPKARLRRKLQIVNSNYELQNLKNTAIMKQVQSKASPHPLSEGEGHFHHLCTLHFSVYFCSAPSPLERGRTVGAGVRL